MSETKTKAQVIKKAIFRIFSWLFSLLFLLVVGLFLLLQSYEFQTFMASKISQWLYERTGYKIEIERVQIHWFDEIALQNVAVYDHYDSLMISAGSLMLDFDLRELIQSSELNFNELQIERAGVQLITFPGEESMNIINFIDQLAALSSKEEPTEDVYSPFRIGRIRVNRLDFLMSDIEADTLAGGIDYNHLRVSGIFADLRDFYLSNDTVSLRVNSMEGVEPGSGFRLNNLRTDFLYSNTQLAFRNLFLSAGTSVVRDSLVFSYADPSALSDFIYSVDIDANLRNSRIYSEEIALFIPAFEGLDQFYRLEGRISGRVNSLSLDDIKLGFGDRSSMEGNIRLDGLPDFENTFLIARLTGSDISTADLRPYLTREIMNQLQQITRTRFSGEFVGLTNDFVANGVFDTNLGQLRSDINLKLNEAVPRYTGSVELINFNVGQMIQNPDVGFVSLRGRVDGRGFTARDADVNLNATFSRLGLLDYDYTGLTTKVNFANNLLRGDIDVKDPNLVFSGTAYIDLRDNRDLININARLDTAYFKNLGLTEEDIFLSTTLYTDLRGLHIDSLSGVGEFTDTYLFYNGRSMTLDSLEFQSIVKADDRTIRLRSNLVDADIFGQFSLVSIAKDLGVFVEELQLALENSEEKIERYYLAKSKEEKPYYRMDFEFKLKDVNPIVQLFEPFVFVGFDTKLDGNFTNGYTSILSFGLEPEALRYGSSALKSNLIDISISKISDSNDILGSIFASSRVLETSGSDSTLKDMSVNLIWNEGKIDFDGRLSQPSTMSYAEVSGIINLLYDRTEIQFLPSNLLALDQEWHFTDDNLITITGEKLNFRDVSLFSEGQRITLDGILSKNPEDAAKLDFDNFAIKNLNPFLPFPLFGVADGFFELRDYYGEQILDIKLGIADLSFDRFLLGNLDLKADWEKEQELLDISLSVFREDLKAISLEGYYAPSLEDQLSLVLSLDKADISFLEPFMTGLFSQIEGQANGQVRISGALNGPIVQGTGQVSNGSMRFDYLNTFYRFEGGIAFTENEIGFRNLILTDVNNNQGRISGGIFHDGFTDFLIDISGSMNNVQVMNTTIRDNELFYGTAYGSGRFNVLGPVNNLLVRVQATTNRNTQIFIPISFGEGIEQSDFIHFVSFRDTVQRMETEIIRQTDVGGIRLDFDITVTPDAYAEIIFDQKAGDIIRARGRGNLKMVIDTQGEFNMFGDLEITEGAYNFSLYGLINKEFVVQPGSRISWLGDPYEAVLDIRALYRQTASLAPLVRNESSLADPAFQRRYPTSVVLALTGSMLAPDIKFSINIEDYPQGNIEIQTLVTSFKFRLENDEQELNRQVFSLILLRSFSPENSFDTGAGGGFGRSVSEFFSGQLSHYISQIDENLEVNIDLAGLDDQAFNTFQLRLSYTLLDGRFRITRDGAVTNLSNEVNVASLAGDLTAEYLLTSDGAFRVKIFSRTNLNMANAALNNAATTTGVSLMYTTSFDTLQDFFANLRRRRPQSPTEATLPEDENEDTSK